MMPGRFDAVRLFLAALVLALASEAGAQPSAATRAPRTPWGSPDLEGTWTGSTLTPLERPAEFAGKAVLTPEEAKTLEGRARERATREPQAARGDPGTYNQIWFDPSSAVLPDRRTSLTLPNGIVVEYACDDDSRLTGLTYKQGLPTLGTLTYGYDAAGQRTSVGGSYARTGLPAALASATYDDANQIATFGGAAFTYDANGNLTSDGVRSYTWNARNELASLTGPVNGSFAYNGFGRRRAKTVGATTTQFLYDGLNPVQELAGGTPTANLLTGL